VNSLLEIRAENGAVIYVPRERCILSGREGQHPRLTVDASSWTLEGCDIRTLAEAIMGGAPGVEVRTLESDEETRARMEMEYYRQQARIRGSSSNRIDVGPPWRVTSGVAVKK
jgi:hypothetical protein